MLKKELKEATKLFFNFNRFFIGMTLLTLFIIKLVLDIQVSFDEMIELLIHPVMLLQAFLMGASLFGREKTEGAFEYMLSLPLSREKIIAQKTLARLFFLLVTLGIYTPLAFISAGFKPLFKFPVLVCLYFSVFLIAASLSLNRRKGAASVFQSLFHFTWISGAFFCIFYLAVYWQFILKEQPRYFKSEKIFNKIIIEQPYGLIAAFFFFSILLFAIFLFRFKRTDLKNQGALPAVKFIRFIPVFIMLFIFGFFIQEYHPAESQAPPFKYELAGSLLLQYNGYDIIIHDQDGRHRLGMDLNNQPCRLFVQPSPAGNKYFVWDGYVLYRLDASSYRLQVVYSMYENDKNLFIKKSGDRIYLGEAGWWRTNSKQYKYSSRLITINLNTEKYSVIKADFLDTEPVFMYSTDAGRNTVLSEILTFKNDQIQTVDLKNGTVLKTDMRIKDIITDLKKKYQMPIEQKIGQIQPISRDELLIGFHESDYWPLSIFRINTLGQTTPWLADYMHNTMPELIQEVIYQEAWITKSESTTALVEFDKNKYTEKVLFEDSLEDVRFTGFFQIFQFLRAEENSDIYFFYFLKGFKKCFFYKILNDGVGFIKEIPSSFKNYSFQLDESDNGIDDNLSNYFFTSGSGLIVKYQRKGWYLNKSGKSRIRVFKPWIKNSIAKVFAFPDLKEIDFGDLSLIND
jgi:ABC-type transport system involved in multi-copper enzyme maturation permease subunit